ncbi:MAG: hypothetical protein GF372_02135, partial [Candidatus Marinimicrobia bacterium]|nr:hypothetical protein [Candidatus Neomarinimicrobiota bacterium]
MIKKVKFLSVFVTLILFSCNNFLTSPDEISTSKIAFIATDNSAAQVYTINSDGSNLKQISQSQTTRVESPRWLPAGEFISYWQSGKLFLVDARGSTPESISDSQHLRPPNHWSPDGQFFTAYGMHNTQQEIYLLSLQNSQLRKISQGSGHKFAGTWSPDGLYVAYIAELGPNLREIIISDEQG